MKALDLAGRRFGMFTVIERNPTNSNAGKSRWNCACDCGKHFVAVGSSIVNGRYVSCGCWDANQFGNVRRTHGKTNTRLYRIWAAMRSRCTNQNLPFYKYYGGRGISVCDEWNNSFETFYQWAMENGYSNALTIDRINSDIGYTPDNCRWATRAEQSRNRHKYGYLQNT